MNTAESTVQRSWVQRWLRPTAEERARRLRREVALITAACAVLIGYALAWPTDFDSAAAWRVCADLAAFMLRTFFLHLGLLLTLTAVVAFRVRQRRVATAAAVAAAITLAPTGVTFLPRGTAASSGPTMTVLSANLYAPNATPRTLFGEILSASADVVALQEYTPQWQAILGPEMRANYPFAVECPQEDCFGAAVFSRLRFAEPPLERLPIGGLGNAQIRVVVELGDRRMALLNVHLLPPSGLEYVRIARREFADLHRMLRSEPAPAILCGDFNFTCESAQGRMLGGLGFRDALDVAGFGPCWTWPALGALRYVPGIRLDHVFLSGGLTATRAAVGVGLGSDHRPVIADVGFAP